MSIQCPLCRKKFGLSSVREGRFNLECPKCGAQFVVRVQVMSQREYSKYRKQRSLEKRAVRKLKELKNQTAGAEVTINECKNEIVAPTLVAQGESSSIAVSASAFVNADLGAHETSANGSDSTNSPHPESLGGYRILKELGRGGMGAVYLAKQNSLNRQVAIKTIRPQLAGNPQFISRFTREAYAAAQLTHHNIVQVYDLAEDHGTHFFSMEFVDGTPLDKLLSERKQLEPRVAIGFVLQAARGLLFAHEHGMVHRDVKPANLLLNQHGIVKVADLGLVKTRNSEDMPNGASRPSGDADHSNGITTVGDSLGTPSFMSPEQCENAAAVDNRADIYSLGCTLYALLTGRPPFTGRSSDEVIKQHKSSQVTPPIKLVQSLPPALSDLNVRMLAKRPNDRPKDLGEVVAQLEGILEKGASPVARYADALAHRMTHFRSSKLALLRPRIIQGLYGIGALVGLFLCLRLQLIAALSVIAIPIVSTVAYVLVRGLLDQSYLVGQFRKLVFASRWMDYLVGLLCVGVFCGGIAITNLYIPAIVSMILGVAAAIGFYFGIDRVIGAERKSSIQSARDVLRQMRLEGMEESSIQRIAADACGEYWEEFFEQLFGYPAKRSMRKLLETERAGMRFYKYAPWRDKIVDGIESRLDELATACQRKRMRKIEMANLIAQGISKSDARKRANDECEIAIEHTLALRASAREFALAGAERRRALRQLVSSARSGQSRRSVSILDRLRKLPNTVLGGKSRFAFGIILLVLGLAWLQHNKVFEGLQQAASSFGSVSDLSDVDVKQLGSNMATTISSRANYESLPFLPGSLGELLGCIGTSLAGLGLVITSPCRGVKSIALAVGGAAMAILGPSLLIEYVPELPFSIPLLQTSELSAYLIAILMTAACWWQST